MDYHRGNVAALSIPAFAPGGAINAAIVVSIPATSSPAFNSVQATVNANTPDPATGNNSSNPSFGITRSVDVSITVSAPDLSENGTAYVYTIVMTNFGPSNLPSQQFSVNWTPAVKALLLVTPGWTSSPPLGSTKVTAATFTSSPLAAGASTSVIVSVITPKRGSVLSATFDVVTPGSTDPVPANNTTTKITSLDPVFINAITLTTSSSTVVSGTAATFTVTVGPENATLPLTYTWVVPNVGTFVDVIDGDVVTDETVTRQFTWTLLGPQTVTVFANNGNGPLPASRTITVTPVTVSGVSLDGPATVQIGATAQFTASVSPLNATPPITYGWLASNQVGFPTPPAAGGITNARGFSWNVLGPQVVTVTASNDASAIATRTINVLPINLTGVVISTPVSIQPVGSAFIFTATTSPANATQPITYTWSAANQSPQTITGAGLTSTQVFTWNVLGPQVVTVTATNQGNTVIGTFIITVSVIPVASAAISTPVSTAPTGTPFTFTANLLPVSSTLPVNYTWTATGQSPQVQAGVNALSSTIVFTWPIAGVQVVTVTANNGGTPVIATRTVTVTNIPPTNIALSSPQVVQPLGSAFTFNASVQPANATTPITYTWGATNQGPQTVIGASSSISFTYAWSVLGPQFVTITAANLGGSPVSTSMIVTVTPVNLASVTINAPVNAAPINTAFVFSANALPVNAAQPITYVWSATGQSPVTQTNGMQLSAPQMFTWTTPGVQTVTVTATNAGNTVTATTLVTVTVVPASVGVAASPVVNVGIPLGINASVNPLNVTLPLTYTWTATNQAGSIVNPSVNSTFDSASYAWGVTGTQQITVVVSNAYGNVVTGTAQLDVVP